MVYTDGQARRTALDFQYTTVSAQAEEIQEKIALTPLRNGEKRSFKEVAKTNKLTIGKGCASLFIVN